MNGRMCESMLCTTSLLCLWLMNNTVQGSDPQISFLELSCGKKTKASLYHFGVARPQVTPEFRGPVESFEFRWLSPVLVWFW